MRPVRARPTMLAAAAALLIALAPAHAQAAGPLSQARFDAIDAVLTAFIPLDRAITSANVAEPRRLCRALDRSDRLLASLRDSCLTTLRLLAETETLDRCSSPSRCRAAAARLASIVTALIRTERAGNTVIAAEVPPGPCRRHLRTTAADLRELEGLRTRLRRIDRGLRARAAASQIQERDRFRLVCAPS